jgi:nitroimidazol reductase NimA-like FMN-containing flavoprotein (pyridoxamine 5'-phosphate oxidase superfamily)
MTIPAELSYETCLTRLREHEVGRVAVCTTEGPRIVPVNYSVLDDDALVIRTTPYSALGIHADGNRLALEIDSVDLQNRSGWSVIATGTGSLVGDSAELRRIHAFRDPGPWAGGQRWLFVALRWDELTGRAVGSRGATMTG